mmetsp:Transcript_5848/g.6697  ORF Transcript_5848/g.6697 Transcript_5848/m.6697 type:complete len:103 (+) Transcript_5848:141-449(+)
MRATGQTTPTLIQSTTTSTLLEGSIPNRSEGDNCTHNDISCYYCDRCMWDHLYQMTIVGKHKHTRAIVGAWLGGSGGGGWQDSGGLWPGIKLMEGQQQQQQQ